MKPILRTWRRFLGTFDGHGREADLAAEFEAHLQMQTEDNLRLGMPLQAARRAAVLKFGEVEALKERYRNQSQLPSLGAFGRDVRYALRAMRNNPSLAAAAILSLALGIGLSTAIFSVANAVLLRPLPYNQPERLASISEGGAIPPTDYDAFRQNARSIQEAALFVHTTFTLTGRGEPMRIPTARVTASLFKLLGVLPELGRTFREEEDRPGNDKVVLIGHALWKTSFGGDPSIVGRTTLLNGVPYRIIGVMPPGFQFPDGPELPDTTGSVPPAQMWRPMAFVEGERTCGGCYNFSMLVRLRPRVTPAQLRAELLTRMKAVAPGQSFDDLTVDGLHDVVTKRVRTPVLVLFGAVTLALLIACVNVANLLLARGLQRGSEIALRLSLGASRRRIVCQLLTEGLVLAFIAAFLAIPLAWVGLRVFLALAPQDLPRLGTVSVDAGMFGFTLLLAIVSALFSAGVPAFLTARHAPGAELKTGSRAVSRAHSRLRDALVVSEFALSLLLLAAAGLLAKSFLELTRTKLGFETQTVLTMRLWLPSPQIDDARRASFMEQLVANCSALHGVSSAAIVSTLPLTGGGSGWGIATEDNPDKYPMLRARMISPDYFRTMGIPLRSGRIFTSADRAKSQEVAIVSESAARLLWPNNPDPIGRRFQGKPGMLLVGIVADTRASGVDTDIVPYIYVPLQQTTPWEFALVVRTLGNPMLLAPAVKAEVRRLDPNQAVTHVETMQQVVDVAIAPWRFEALLMAVFAGFALVLAAVGIYGVLSYSVARRTSEVGIRMALGESRLHVVLGIMRHAGTLAILGTAVGLVSAILAMRFLRSLLYGVAPAESSVLVGCAGLLLLVGLLAAVVPARRAASLNPAQCLRNE